MVEIRIDEAGKVSAQRVVKGHPLLNDAAVETVSQWKYEPVVFDGHVIPIVMTVAVSFEPQ